MVKYKQFVMAGLAGVLAWSGLAAAPAQAADEGYTSLVAHTSEADPADDKADVFSAGQVHVRQHPEGITMWTDVVDENFISASFSTIDGQPLVVGRTYTSHRYRPDEWTATDGFLAVHRAGTMCFEDWNTSKDGRWRRDYTAPGTFTVHELKHDADGAITRFRATYELSCQRLGGRRGAEGSVAYTATEPAGPVPTVVLPGPVTDFRASNVDPGGQGSTTTTVSWTKPPGATDVIIDSVRSSDPADLPAGISLVGHRESTGSKTFEPLDFMESFTYRATPRTASGRLGPSTTLTVLGTRLAVPAGVERIQVGEVATVAGRLSKAFEPGSGEDPMNGPGIVGQSLQLCNHPGGKWNPRCEAPVATTTTSANGQFTFRVRPDENSWYSVRLLPGPAIIGNHAAFGRVALVSPKTDLSAPGGQVDSARAGVMRRGSVIRFSTSRARVGNKGTVRLQRLDGRSWRTLKTARIATRGAQRMSIPFREWKAGTHQYRAVKAPDARHVTGYSKVVRVRVG